MVRKLVYSVLCIAALVAAMSFTAPTDKTKYGKVEIYVNNTFQLKKLVLDSVTYRNAINQPYTVSMLKYYVGHFILEGINGKVFESHKYFLVDQSDTNSLQFEIDSVPVGKYHFMGFTIGVDSTDNCSGAQSGALDPVNGMFWAWNTGYIFFKMEGKSPASNSTGKRLEYHIGGYKSPNNCIRTCGTELEGGFSVQEEYPFSATITTDISKLFYVNTIIDFRVLSSVTDFHNAKTIADNYWLMFNLTL